MKIRAADQRAEESNERNERRVLIVEMFLGRAYYDYHSNCASGEIIRGEQTGGGESV